MKDEKTAKEMQSAASAKVFRLLADCAVKMILFSNNDFVEGIKIGLLMASRYDNEAKKTLVHDDMVVTDALGLVDTLAKQGPEVLGALNGKPEEKQSPPKKGEISNDGKNKR